MTEPIWPEKLSLNTWTTTEACAAENMLADCQSAFTAWIEANRQEIIDIHGIRHDVIFLEKGKADKIAVEKVEGQDMLDSIQDHVQTILDHLEGKS